MTESKIIKAETKEKQEHVLQILEEQGYTWQSGNKPTELVPYDFYRLRRKAPTSRKAWDERSES